MKEILILVGYFSIAAVFTTFGFLLLFSPKGANRLLRWLSSADRWSRPNPEWDPGRAIESRITGLILGAMGLMFIAVPLYWIFTSGPSQVVPVDSFPPKAAGVNWGSFVISGGVLFLGGYLVLNPRVILPWAKRTMPDRILLDNAPRITFLVVRLIGALLIAFGLYEIALTLKH